MIADGSASVIRKNLRPLCIYSGNVKAHALQRFGSQTVRHRSIKQEQEP